MRRLTKRQRELLDFIEEFRRQNRYEPSYRQIMQQFGFSSKGTVSKHMKALMKKESGGQEGRIGLPSPAAEIELPFIGAVSASHGCSLFPSPESISVPRTLISSEQSYALRVYGRGFEEEMIRDGDLLLLKPDRDIPEGELTLLAFEAGPYAIKKIYPEGAYVRLESSVAGRDALYIRTEELQVQGAVTGLIRLI